MLANKTLTYRSSTQTLNEMTSVLKFIKRNFYLLGEQPIVIYSLVTTLAMLIRKTGGALEDYAARLLI